MHIDYIGTSRQTYRLYRYFRTSISIIRLCPERHIDYIGIFGQAYRIYRYFQIGISIISVIPDWHIDYTDTTNKTDTDTGTDIIYKRYPTLLVSFIFMLRI